MRNASRLEAYGADPDRWPAAERAAALALLQSSPAAAQSQRDAAALDQLLDLDLARGPNAQLHSRILVALPVPTANWRDGWAELWQEIGGWRLAAPAFALSVSLGLWLPTLLDDSVGDLPAEDLIAAVQLIDDLPDLNP